VVGEPKSHIYWDHNDPLWAHSTTRPILEITLALPDGHELTVLVNHWSSSRHGQTSKIKRYQAAEFVRELVKKKMAENPQAEIMVMGDFNAPPTSAEIIGGLRPYVKASNNFYDSKQSAREVHLYNLYDTSGSFHSELKIFKSLHPEHGSAEEWTKFYQDMGKKYGTYFGHVRPALFNFSNEFNDFHRANPYATSEKIKEFYSRMSQQMMDKHASASNGWETFDQIFVSPALFKKFIQGTNFCETF
jgi:hypothetical protein